MNAKVWHVQRMDRVVFEYRWGRPQKATQKPRAENTMPLNNGKVAIHKATSPTTRLLSLLLHPFLFTDLGLSFQPPPSMASFSSCRAISSLKMPSSGTPPLSQTQKFLGFNLSQSQSFSAPRFRSSSSSSSSSSTRITSNNSTITSLLFKNSKPKSDPPKSGNFHLFSFPSSLC